MNWLFVSLVILSSIYTSYTFIYNSEDLKNHEICQCMNEAYVTTSSKCNQIYFLEESLRPCKNVSIFNLSQYPQCLDLNVQMYNDHIENYKRVIKNSIIICARDTMTCENDLFKTYYSHCCPDIGNLTNQERITGRETLSVFNRLLYDLNCESLTSLLSHG